jgi:glycosyltransferase involved in cell wall biosynthesis
MDLLIDGQPIQTPPGTRRGIDRLTLNLLHALHELRPDWRLRFTESTQLPSLDRSALPPGEYLSFHPPLPAEPRYQDINGRFYADWLCGRAPDAILLPSAITQIPIVPFFVGARPPLFAIVHDFIPLLFHRHYLNAPMLDAQYGRRLRHLLRADGLFANSETTAADARSLPAPVPEVVVIGGATDPTFGPLSLGELAVAQGHLRQRGVDRPFILYVGGGDTRKNLLGAMRAFAALPDCHRRQFDLLFAGGEFSDTILAHYLDMARREGVEDSVKFLGGVTDTELRALYATCRLFLFPSVYEGIGLPLLEALRCGAPVVAYAVSSIPEYAGDVCHLAPLGPPLNLTAAMLAALAEPPELRRAERMNHPLRFSWRRSAERFSAGLLRLLQRSEPSRRPRLAWSSPHEDTVDVTQLARHFQIDFFMDSTSALPSRDLCTRHRVLTLPELARQHIEQPYDLIVHQIGAAGPSSEQRSLLDWFGGIVILNGGNLFAELNRATAILVPTPADAIAVRSQVRTGCVMPMLGAATWSCLALVQLLLADEERAETVWAQTSAALLHHLDAVGLAEAWSDLRMAGQAALRERLRRASGWAA